MKKIHLIRRVIKSNRNSSCASARLCDLDWSNWWTDNSFESHYLHVKHKDGETVHRVFCRISKNPRIGMYDNILKWLIDKR